MSDIFDVNTELTNIVQGYPRPQGLFAEQIFPVIPLDDEDGKFRSYGKDFFLQYNALRALNADTLEVGTSTSSQISYHMEEYALNARIDYRILAKKPGYKAREAEATAQKILNGFEKTLADTLQDTASYDSGNSETVSTSTDKWGYYTSGGSDVIGQVEDARIVIADKIGIDPNTLLLAHNTYTKLKQHPQFLDKIKYSQKAVVTLDLMKEFLEVENIFVSKAKYTDSPTGSFTKMYDECAVLMYIAPESEAGEETPTFGYTLRKKGFPLVGDHQSLDKKIQFVGVTYIQQQIITCNQAGYLFKNVL